MASDTVERISPQEDPAEESAREILRRMNTGEQLTRDNESSQMAKRHKKKQRAEQRRRKYERELTIYERALRKQIGGLELTSQESEILRKFSAAAYRTSAAEVQINPRDILNDVVRGDYTLQDVSVAQLGEEVTPVDASPMQMLETIVEDTKKRTQEALCTVSESAQFFQSIESDPLNRVTPMQLENIIATCTAGIDMMQETSFEDNEAKSACESLVKALAMQEGETKIKSAIEEGQRRRNKELEKLAEAGAVAAATSEHLEKEMEPQEEKEFGFNITNSSFDLSFVPCEDPDVHKPLEIISYIGMTT